jgi:hypothetical protein
MDVCACMEHEQILDTPAITDKNRSFTSFPDDGHAEFRHNSDGPHLFAKYVYVSMPMHDPIQRKHKHMVLGAHVRCKSSAQGLQTLVRFMSHCLQVVELLRPECLVCLCALMTTTRVVDNVYGHHDAATCLVANLWDTCAQSAIRALILGQKDIIRAEVSCSARPPTKRLALSTTSPYACAMLY